MRGQVAVARRYEGEHTACVKSVRSERLREVGWRSQSWAAGAEVTPAQSRAHDEARARTAAVSSWAAIRREGSRGFPEGARPNHRGLAGPAESALVKEQTAHVLPQGAGRAWEGRVAGERRRAQSGQGLQTRIRCLTQQGQPRQAPGAVPAGGRQAGPRWGLLGSRDVRQRGGRALWACGRPVRAPPQSWRRVSQGRGQQEPGAETAPRRRADRSLSPQDSPGLPGRTRKRPRAKGTVTAALSSAGLHGHLPLQRHTHHLPPRLVRSFSTGRSLHAVSPRLFLFFS